MHEVCAEREFCGRFDDVSDRATHASDFYPESGMVSADQWVDWLIAADLMTPQDGQPHRMALREAFVRHMGAEAVDVLRLCWSDA